jgi:hypothetical protein
MINFIKKNKFLLFLLTFFSLYHFITANNLEFYYDDWFFVSIINNSDKFLQNFNIIKEIYIVRPIGMLYLTLLSFFKFNNIIFIYIFNLFLWVLSGVIIAVVLKKNLIFFSKYFFLLFYLFPSISNSFIYSPIIQGLSTVAVFFWSISLYFSSKKNRIILSIFFIALSLLTYELTIALIPLNVLIYIINKNLLNKKINEQIIFLIKLVLISLTFLILFYLLQNILSLFSSGKIIKYGFFEYDFINNAIKFFFQPLSLVFVQIPKLWIDGFILFFENINFIKVLLLIIINIIIIFYFFQKNNSYNKKISLKLLFIYNIMLAIVFFGIFLVYLVATSVPDLKGYYNRGLLGLHIWICLFIMQILYFRNFAKKFFSLLGILILNLNLISFYEQHKIHVNNSLIRNDIINKTIELSKKETLIFSNFETYSKIKYNFIPIFSDEVYDYSNSINAKTNNSLIAHRIYKNTECKKILNFDNNIFSGLVPSRNRKTTEEQKIVFLELNYNKVDQKILIYNYVENKFIVGKINELQSLLQEVFNCH